MDFATVSVEQKPDCPVCGSDPEIESVHDVTYEASCAIDAGPEPLEASD